MLAEARAARAGGGEALGIDALRRRSETRSDMRHVIEIPDEIEQALEKRASETGDNVAHIIICLQRRLGVGGRSPTRSTRGGSRKRCALRPTADRCGRDALASNA